MVFESRRCEKLKFLPCWWSGDCEATLAFMILKDFFTNFTLNTFQHETTPIFIKIRPHQQDNQNSNFQMNLWSGKTVGFSNEIAKSLLHHVFNKKKVKQKISLKVKNSKWSRLKVDQRCCVDLAKKLLNWEESCKQQSLSIYQQENDRTTFRPI